MKPDGRLLLISEVRDLQIVDCDRENCGIVDELELEGAPGGKLRIKAILVGPGAYRGRLPRWMAGLARLVAGDKIVRVPWDEVETIGTTVRLRRSAAALGLGVADRRLQRKMPQPGVLDATR